MTRSASKPAGAPQDTPAMAAAMMAVNPAGAKMWLDMVNEAVRFASERLRSDLETQKAMLACKGPTEMVEVQSAFFRKAVEQYTEESVRLFEIMQGAATEMAKDVKSGHSRGYDDVPL
ncbi:MAG: phasin family protein [Roseovarius sp.]|nr:phasin family protein [Roseovarius sp.]